MVRFAASSLILTAGLVSWLSTTSLNAQTCQIDPAHCAVTFRVSHLGLSYTYGRFNKVEGLFSIDADNPANTSFSATIRADSIDTGNQQRDDHLRSPDFLNVRQFPVIEFQSTKVEQASDGYMVTGDFTLHGQTRPITMKFAGGKTAEFPRGVQRTGFSTELQIKRSDFGIDGMLQAIGDEIEIFISFEGIKK